MFKSWPQTILALVAVGVGLLLTFIAGIHVYMTSTATPLHPEPAKVPAVVGSKPSPAWTAAVEQGREIARASLAEQNLPGLSVAVGVDDDIVWAECFGWANIEMAAPVRPETRFNIGTASVVLTSAAVGVLLEKGQLKLDDEIQTYVPEYPKKEWPVTVRQVMAHVAGVRTDSGDESPLFSQHCERPVDALQFFADRPLLFEPGTRFRYSDYGWILVSAVVEAAAGEGFSRFMRNHVFDPVGMTDTKPDSADEISDRATSYFPRYAADPSYGLHLMRGLDLSCYAGASVFLSTAPDLVRFGMAIDRGRLRQGSGAERKLLQRDTVDTFQASQRLPSGEETGYGLGWDLEPVTLAGEQTHVVGHDGEIGGGMVASLMTFPERGIVVAVMSNISYADTFTIGSKIAEAFAKRGKTSK
jgi:serine beta-lactamase-like protein LACTB